MRIHHFYFDLGVNSVADDLFSLCKETNLEEVKSFIQNVVPRIKIALVLHPVRWGVVE